jgi:HEAT repeat protein
MGITFKLDDIQVPLGLIKRPEKVQPQKDVSPDKGSQVYREVKEKEKITPIDYDDFFQQVLANQQSPKNNGKHLTIIGEPGAGKTTQLLKIADWVLDETEGLPIWISLGVVREKPLQEYLLKDWLRDAAGRLDAAPPEWVEQLEQHLKNGRVWLLLDGADEMQVADPLGKLAEFVRVPLLKNVRVVLTCRLNLWDAAGNALSEFDTYKMLDFSYGDGKNPDQVKQFIDKWFGNPSLQEAYPCVGGTEGGQQLRKALDETGKERIKDLARNPLRLALLCFTWQSGRGKLPDTKAELYELLVAALYVLKKGVFPTTSAQQRDLNAALGQLALKAIDKGFKSILPHSLVYEELEKPHPELFELADKLGWLNKVGVEPENPLKPVYAFFHPTFQEYFAATVIDDWEFFLPRDHIDKPVRDKDNSERFRCYRVFEPQWKEVFLLWMGQPEEKISDNNKEALLKALLDFKSGLKPNFYWYQSFFIAVSGISEFRNFTQAEEVLNQLINWCFFQVDNLEFPYPLSSLAKEALKEINSQAVIAHLIKVLFNVNNEKIRESITRYLIEVGVDNPLVALALIWIIKETLSTHNLLKSKRGGVFLTAVEGLGEVGVVNQIAVEELINILRSTNKVEIYAEDLRKSLDIDDPRVENLDNLRWVIQDIRLPALNSLGKIGTSNQIAVKALQELIEATQDEETLARTAEILWKINPGCSTAIKTLKNLLLESSYGWIIQESAWILEEISASDHRGIETLFKVLITTHNEETRQIVSSSLGTIKTENHKVIETLVKVFWITQNSETRRSIAESLGKVGTSNSTAIEALREILRTDQDDYTRREAAESLGKIEPGNTTAIAALTELLHIVKEQWLLCSTATTLWEINPGNRSAIKTLRELCATKNENLCLRAAESLGKINPRDLIAIETLIRIACMDSDVGEIEREAAKILYAIGTNNKTVIETLIQFLRTEKNELGCVRIAKILGKIDTGNQTAIDKLIKIIGTTHKEGIYWDAAEYLGEISPDHPIAIEALIKLLYNPQWGWFRDQFIVDSLGKLGIGNQNAIETLIQILLTSQNHQLRSKAAEGLKKIRQEEFLVKVVKSLKSNVQDEVYEKDFHLYQECKAVILYCSQNLSYQKFYQAWDGNKDSTFSGEAQKLDFNQLQPTDYTYPLAVNILSLKEETEQAAIAQKLCNKIYKHQVVKIPGKPPTAKNDAELQQHLFEIQEKLQRPNLALVLYIKDTNGFHEPTEEAIAFCQKLAEPDLGIHIAWITNQPLEQILKDIQPNRPKLISKIQSWIDKIL